MPRPPSLALRAYRFLNRPYYLYRPAQLARRALQRGEEPHEPRLLRTAWGESICCWPDPLGKSVARTGIYDLTVSETLARLADAGETAVDAGANVGVMTSLLAIAVGPSGRVLSYEPHPDIFEVLERNVERWSASPRQAAIEARRAAISEAQAVLQLSIDPETFAANKGTASLAPGQRSAHGVQVQAVTLDDELAAPVGVLKLDVEMHELEALRGAQRLLRERLVRDIVFEEHEPPPTPVTELLESHGYSILGVRQGITGPVLADPAEAYRLRMWDPPALLATTDEKRARERLRARGWRCLRRGLRR